MPKEPRPAKVKLPKNPTNTHRDTTIGSILDRLDRLEADEDQRAAKAASMRKPKE